MLISLTLVAALGVAVLTSLVLTPLARRIALKVRAVDLRTPKKIHRHDIPRLGGIAIAGAFYAAIVVFACNIGAYHQQISRNAGCLLVLLAGGALMLGLGIYDDLRGASAATKLAVQIPVAALTWIAGIRLGTIVGPSGETLIIPAALSLAATVVWVVGVTNAINLMDGLDGLAAGIATQTLAAVALCASHLHEPMLAGLMIVMVGAVAGFLRYNFHPARIFMGDSGSLFLGYMIAAGSVWCSQRATTLMVAVLPLVMLALPLLDTILAVLRRLKRGQRITAGDLEHIHHQVLTIGRSQTRSVLILYGVNFVFNALAVLLAFSGGSRAEWTALGASVVVAAGFLGWLHTNRPPRHLDVVAIRRRNLLVRRALFELEGSLLRCERADDLREALRSFHETIHGEFGEQPAVVPPASAQANS